VIAAPLLVVGLLLTLSALNGARVASGGRGAALSFLLSPLHPATWAATAAVLVGFWVGLFAFMTVIGLFSAGASLLVVGVGVVLAGLAVEAARIFARIERRRASWADPRPLIPHPYRPYGSGLRDVLYALFLDLSRWRDVVYVLVGFPLAVLEFAAVLALWIPAIGFLSMPVWFLTGEIPFDVSGVPAPEGAVAALGGIVGLALLPVASTVTRGLMTLHRAVVSGLLCASERQVLQRRVETLETSRRAVLDVEATELRRIERDLHDGAQQRLVMLAINLGLAEDRIDTDPAGAKVLVSDARDQARQALAELRDLVRGIAPSILLDRAQGSRAIAGVLRAPGWRPVYADRLAVVLVREEFAAAHGLPRVEP
jgi:signal transduction histidine kinase